MTPNEYDDLIAAENGPLRGAAPANEYDAIIEQDTAGQKSAIKQSMFAAVQREPDRMARVRELSEKAGLPENIVESNYETLDRKFKVETTDYDDIIAKSPRTAEFIADPRNAALVADDIDGLRQVESVVEDHGTLSTLYDALNQGLGKTYASMARVPGLAARVAYAPQNKVADLTGWEGLRVNVPDEVVNNPVAKYYDDAAKAYETEAASRSAIEEARKGNYSKAGMTLAAKAVTSFPQMFTGIVATVASGGTAGLATMVAQSSAARLGENIEKGVEPETALGNAVTIGTIEGAFERTGTLGLFKSWSNAITAELGTAAASQVIKNFWKTMLHTSASEGKEEAFTEVTQSLTDYVMGVNPDALKDLPSRTLEAFAVGAVASGGMTAPSAAVTGYARLDQAKRAQVAKDTYLAMGSSVEALKLRGRLPEASRAFVEQVVRGKPVETIYINRDAAIQFFQSESDPAAKALTDAGVQAAFDEAKATGTDMKVPLATWANHFAGTPAYQALADHIKFDPLAQTVDEARVERTETAAQVSEADLETVTDPDLAGAEPVDPAASARQVQTEIETQLRAAGADVSAAPVMADAFRVLGERSGIDPLELFRQYNPQTVGVDSIETGAESDAQLNQVTRETAPVFYSKLQRTVEQKFGKSGTVEQVRALMRDLNKEEVQYSGIESFLSGKEKVSKQELLDYLAENQIQIQDVPKTQPVDGTDFEKLKRIGESLKPLEEATKQAHRTVLNERSKLETNLQAITKNTDATLGLTKNLAMAKTPEEIASATAAIEFLGADPVPYLEATRLSREARETYQARRDEWNAEKEKDEADPRKFGQYVLPGGENYREILFTLPDSELPKGHELLLFEEWAERNERSTKHTPDFDYVVIDQDNRIAGHGFTPEEASANFKRVSKGKFQSSHWDESNVLAHVRTNDRVDADGKKVLFVEEIQSDWHQAGRKKGYKGDTPPVDFDAIAERTEKLRQELFTAQDDAVEYIEKKYPDVGAMVAQQLFRFHNTNADAERQAAGQKETPWYAEIISDPNLIEINKRIDQATAAFDAANAEKTAALDQKIAQQVAVPDAPFKKTWHEYALKRILRMAAEGGYDRVAWTTGEQQAERYDLSKQVDSVSARKNENGSFDISVFKDEDIIESQNGLSPDAVAAALGKDLAEKIIAESGKPQGSAGWLNYSGVDLKVGGEGMKGFYDKIVPAFLSKYTKKWGGRVGDTVVLTNPAYTAESLAGGVDDTVKGLLIEKGEGVKAHSLEITPEMRDALLHEGQALFQGARGRIDLTDRANVVIELSKSRNASTWFHESGHLYLEILGDLASRADAPEQIKADYQTVLEYLGVSERGEIGREQHETWARSFEAYIMEGKAPSEKLREAFDRFRVWLVRVYQSIVSTESLNVNLTDDVRSVMDRMLATDAEIAEVRGTMQAAPLFNSAAQAGMTREQSYEYARAIHDAETESKRVLDQKLMASYRKTQSRIYKEEQVQVRAEVETEMRTRPVYRAIEQLRTGSQPDGRPFKLSRDAVDQYGKQIAANLPRGVVASRKSGEGLNPDVAAEFFGYGSGNELISDLMNAPTLEKAIETETSRRMAELFPDLLTDGQLPAEALSAFHNQSRSKLLRMELQYLANHELPTLKNVIRKVARRVPTEKAVRAEAVRIVGAKAVRDIDPKLYQRAEIKAARDAGILLARGDIEGAFEAKRRELLNHELFRAATEARETVRDALEDFKRFGRKDEVIAKTREMDLVNTGRAVLARAGIGKVDNPVASYLAQIKQYGPDTYASVEAMLSLVDNINPDFRDGSFDDFVQVVSTVDALWDLAKTEREIEIDGQKMQRDQAIEALNARIAEIAKPGPRAEYAAAVSDEDKRITGLQGIRSALRRVESWSDAMGAEFTKYVWRPVSDAVTKYRLAKKVKVQEYLTLLEQIRPGLTYEEILAPEIGYKFSGKAELLGALLHIGNESNLSKLIRGGGDMGRAWGTVAEDGTLDTRKFDDFRARMEREGVLTKADYDFLQAVWDLNETMKPDAQKAHKQLYGRYFSEITANEVQTSFGVYRGGYMPAVVDPHKVSQAAVREEKELIEKNNNSFMFPSTGRGFTHSRVDQYAAPLAFDLKYVAGHIDKVLRFTHINPTVAQVGRVVMNKSFREAMAQIDPTVVDEMLIPWLQRAATQRVVLPNTGAAWRGFDRFWTTMRSRTGMNIMVGNVVNTLQQATGLFLGAVKVHPRYLRNALWGYVHSPKKLANLIAEKSDYMRADLEGSANEALGVIDEIIVNPGKFEQIQEFTKKHGYFLQVGAQNIVNLVVWQGAYEQAVEQGQTDKQAVKSADAAVRLTQGSGAAESVSRFETGTPFMRAFSMFASYFNMYSNLMGSEVTKVVRDLGLKKGAGRLFYIYAFGMMLPSVVNDIIVRVFSGKGLDEDDDDQYLDDVMAIFFGSQLRTATAFFPIAGPAINAGVNSFNDKPYDDRISTSPVIATLESATGVGASVYNAIAEGKNPKRAVRDVLSVVGLLTGLPTASLARPLGYMTDVATGNAQPTGPIDATRGLITGKAGDDRK